MHVPEGGEESGSLTSAKEEDAAASHSTPQRRTQNANATTTAATEESTATTPSAQVSKELEMILRKQGFNFGDLSAYKSRQRDVHALFTLEMQQTTLANES